MYVDIQKCLKGILPCTMGFWYAFEVILSEDLKTKISQMHVIGLLSAQAIEQYRKSPINGHIQHSCHPQHISCRQRLGTFAEKGQESYWQNTALISSTFVCGQWRAQEHLKLQKHFLINLNT